MEVTRDRSPAKPEPLHGGDRNGRPGATGLAALGVGLLGVALRLWQYGANASLWADEANLALNIIERSPRTILGPLDYRQVAPPGWLLLEKAAVAALGDGELVLRLVPLLGSLLALPLFWSVARRVLPPGAPPVLALGLLAVGIPFIDYAAQVKPYATDVVLAVALLGLALAVHDGGPGGGRPLALGALGVVAPWFSYPAMLVLAGLGVTLGGLALRDRTRRLTGPLAAMGIAWAVSAVGALLWARSTLTPDDVAYLERFWGAWFWPWPPRSLREVGWPIARLTTVYGGGGLRYPAPGVFLVLAVVGAWALIRRAPAHGWLVVGPILATFAAAALHRYPFAPRLVLFLFPGFLLLTAAGVHALSRLGRRGPRFSATAVLATAVLAVAGLARHPPPYAPEPLKPVLEAVRAGWEPGDRLYVYYGAEKAFVYYARRYGFARDAYVLGRCARDDLRAYLRELDAFRGTRRLWVLLAHALPELEEDTAILGYLDRIGARRVTVQRGGSPGRQRGRDVARVDLYDLSEPARLGAATAETFPLPPRAGSGRSCHPGT